MHLPSWLNDAVFYEIYPQSFYDSNADGIGDFPGMIQKLDYLTEMGFNAIWINPCFDSPFMDAGYDVRDYYKIAPRYGTNDDAYRFFSEAHKRGFHVLLDLVPGHTSDQHPWFLKSREPEANEYTNRYIWTSNAFQYPEGFRMMSGMSDRDANYMVNFFSTQPALNYGFENCTAEWQLPTDHPDAQASVEAMKAVMRFWLEHGCDGFRVDMASSLVKNDPQKTGIKRLWKGVREMLEREYPEAVILSEWGCAEEAIDSCFHLDFYLHFGNVGYNSLFQMAAYDYVNPGRPVHCFFDEAGEGNIRVFVDEFTQKLDYIRGRGYMCVPTGNHDMFRYSFRRSQEDMKLAAAFIMLLPAVPFVYYGDEIGMRYRKGMRSKEGGYFRTASRTPMQWDKGTNMGFSTTSGELYLPVDDENGAVNVAAQQIDSCSLLNTIKRFIALRHAEADLQADGGFEVLYAAENRYPFVFRRGNFIVAVNPSGKAQTCVISGDYNAKDYQETERIGERAIWEGGNLCMPAVSLAVFKKE